MLISLVHNASFLIVKNSCVREELIDITFFLQTQLQQITVQEHLFGAFAHAPPTFGPCTSPTDTFPFTYHFPSMSIPICRYLNCSPICVVDNFQRLQRPGMCAVYNFQCLRFCSLLTSSQESVNHKSTFMFTFTLSTIYEVNDTAK